MKHTYHVMTPLARYQNLEPLIRMLEPKRIHWHVVTDKDVPFRLMFHQYWIHHYVFDNKPGSFWEKCNSALNWMMDTMTMYPEHRYCMLNDDDAYEPDFFSKIDEVEGDLIIASMQRGNQTPAGVIPERAHGTGTLVAAPENMAVGRIGVEQFVASGEIMAKHRLPIHICGDGMMIVEMASKHKPVYVPDAFVWFNYFEPGRWNK